MLKKIDPTPEQRAIIDHPGEKLVVLAAAGAGKTAVLVERYLKYVRDGFAPDEILTITFTKKAAAEMKRRIVANLRDEGRLHEAQVAETGPIQTIHSFCERLLRENALEAGIDPSFEIISDVESSRQQDFAIRSAISSDDLPPEAERLIAFLAGKMRYGNSSPYGEIEASISSVLDGLRGSGIEPTFLEETLADPVRFRQYIDRQILDEQTPEVKAGVRLAPGDHLHAALQQAYRDLQLRPQSPISKRLDREIDELVVLHTSGLLQLCQRAWMTLEQNLYSNHKLDFNALEARAITLLETSIITRDRVGQQYKIIMVDEAQDVNPLQDRLISLMNIERELIVGDPQQSIYGFRLADPERFRERAKMGQSLPISVNQRCSAGVIQTVDDVFGNLWREYHAMRPPPKPMDFENNTKPDHEGVEVWLQQVENLDELANHLLAARAESYFSWSDVAALVRKTKFAVRLKEVFDRHEIPCRIAGGSENFYTRLEIRDVANTLRSLGNPYDDYALLAMLRSPVVGLSLDSISLLAQKKPVVDSLATLHPTVAEDAARIERFLTWFTPLREIADRIPAWELLGQFLATSDYLASLASRRNGSQQIANVRKLLRLAASEPELTSLDYAEQIREIQILRHREGDAPTDDEAEPKVTITTVHKAKGLEWPVVLIPEVHERLTVNPGAVEVDARRHLTVAKFTPKSSFYHDWIASKRHERDAAEEERLLYVAMTRARERLFLVAHNAANPNSMARKLASALGITSLTPSGFRTRSAEPEA